jgi:hypothetical protein
VWLTVKATDLEVYTRDHFRRQSAG